MDREDFDQKCASLDDEALVYWLQQYTMDEDLIDVIPYADAEIKNGGLFQYYGNGSFEAKQHVKFLELIGALDHAEIIRQSLARFPDGIQPIRTEEDPDEHHEAVAELIGGTKAFYDLDDRYFALPETLDDSIQRYVRQHLDFYFDEYFKDE